MVFSACMLSADCSKVQCPPPPTNCASMQRVTHLPGVCCPIYMCRPVESQVIEDKCKDVQCPQVYECKHNKRQVTYPGECCPVCEKVLLEEAIEAVNEGIHAGHKNH